jgi:hypothetical protein
MDQMVEQNGSKTPAPKFASLVGMPNEMVGNRHIVEY